MTRTLTFALLLAIAACGGKDKAAPATGATTMKQPDGEGDVHTGMPPEMTRFHGVLRPLWHAEMGPKRTSDTCAAVPQLQTEADAIAKATPPQAANADTWTKGTNELVAAVGGVATACNANDSAGFETAFTRVHDAFHALMAQGKMHHENVPLDGPDGAGSAGSAGAGSAAPAHDHGSHEH